VKVHTVQQSNTCKSRGGNGKKRPVVESDITLTQHFTIPTIIVSALAEKNSRAFTSSKEKVELEGLDDEHREMIAAFTYNVLSNIEIEHIWQNGKSSLGLQSNTFI
jgi:hypothetical protein